MKITRTNLFVLQQVFGDADTASPMVSPVNVRHLQRCQQAGLFVADRAAKLLRLTEAGKQALGRVLA